MSQGQHTPDPALISTRPPGSKGEEQMHWDKKVKSISTLRSLQMRGNKHPQRKKNRDTHTTDLCAQTLEILIYTTVKTGALRANHRPILETHFSNINTKFTDSKYSLKAGLNHFGIHLKAHSFLHSTVYTSNHWQGEKTAPIRQLSTSCSHQTERNVICLK